MESRSIPTILGKDLAEALSGTTSNGWRGRRLIRMMAQDGWGAPRIHAELTKLGFIISEKTVSRYTQRLRAEPDQVKRWVRWDANERRR
ncbi:MAG: hypothetical protein E2P02_16945 [Acidobacteria bacterium]|nr:MAG: hypothetical protein E2P02_16945 [Acidobacteriota bacterium]